MKTIMSAVVLTFCSAVAWADPAAVINGDGCGLLDGNGGSVFTTDTHSVQTASANNNALFKCQADVAAPASGRAVRYDFTSTNIQCGMMTQTGLVLTSKWEETVSASGQATLICHNPG